MKNNPADPERLYSDRQKMHTSCYKYTALHWQLSSTIEGEARLPIQAPGGVLNFVVVGTQARDVTVVTDTGNQDRGAPPPHKRTNGLDLPAQM